MPLTIYPHALTTLANVKGYLKGLSDTSQDDLLIRLILASTDFIEGECDRRFLKATYTNELHTFLHLKKTLPLKQFPLVGEPSSLQYKAGTPSSPSWTSYLRDDWDVSDAEWGIIELLGGKFPIGAQKVRVTYEAGYLIDWTNQGTNTHTLPADITALCERLVIRHFKRREHEGKSAETTSQGTISFLKDLDEVDKMVIDSYKRKLFV
jgi:hypothetical protein